jgi:hypothetical protein
MSQESAHWDAVAVAPAQPSTMDEVSIKVLLNMSLRGGRDSNTAHCTNILIWTSWWVSVGVEQPRMTLMELSLNPLGRKAPRGTVRALVDGAFNHTKPAAENRTPNQNCRSYIDLRVRRCRESNSG